MHTDKETNFELIEIEKKKINILKSGKILLPAKLKKEIKEDRCQILINEKKEIGIKGTNETENSLRIHKTQSQATICFKQIFEYGYEPKKYEYDIKDGIIRIKKQA